MLGRLDYDRHGGYSFLKDEPRPSYLEQIAPEDGWDRARRLRAERLSKVGLIARAWRWIRHALRRR